jgi:hypothetical protein
MIHDYLVAWINWYYGDGQYPDELRNKMTYEQCLEATEKTEQIKKIVRGSR